MTVDPKGRLIVSDQYGKLYRVTLPPVGTKGGEIGVEPIDAPIGEAHGLLWAFDSLYVVVNRGRTYESGLYRVTDTNNDDRLDKVELLRKLDGGGEHGPHAVILAPDGKSLYVVAGNATRLTELDGSLVPRVWGEDNLLPRMVDGAGFMTNEKAPGGHIYRVSPDGKHWELVAMGYRNPFDIAFNRAGELFTYDSDMEWDVQHALVSAHPRAPRRQRRRLWLSQRLGQVAPLLHRQPAAGGQRRPRLAHRRDLRLRREVPGEISGCPLPLRLELRQALCPAPRPQGRDLRGRARGVSGRNAAGPDGRRRQSQGRRDVFRGGRAEHAVGTLSRDLSPATEPTAPAGLQ